MHLNELRLMPCHIPTLREPPSCAAEHRVAMVRLAVDGEPRLACDDRELLREGPSYTIDSLIETRAEVGAERSVCMVLGCDALLDIPRWHRWQELLDWAHIIVLARPGWELPHTGAVAQWLEQHRLKDCGESPEELEQQLSARAAGSILVQELRPLAISATEIRELLAAGFSARYLMPQTVLDYIHQHRLYQ